MDQTIIDKIKKRRDDLAYQIETLIQDFTNKTNYFVEKMTVDYKDTDSSLVPKQPVVRLSIRLGMGNSSSEKE